MLIGFGKSRKGISLLWRIRWCRLFFVRFMTPVPEVAGVGHSGVHPEAGQDEFLQNHPDHQKCDYQQHVFHTVALNVDICL